MKKTVLILYIITNWILCHSQSCTYRLDKIKYKINQVAPNIKEGQVKYDCDSTLFSNYIIYICFFILSPHEPINYYYILDKQTNDILKIDTSLIGISTYNKLLDSIKNNLSELDKTILFWSFLEKNQKINLYKKSKNSKVWQNSYILKNTKFASTFEYYNYSPKFVNKFQSCRGKRIRLFINTTYTERSKFYKKTNQKYHIEKLLICQYDKYGYITSIQFRYLCVDFNNKGNVVFHSENFGKIIDWLNTRL